MLLLALFAFVAGAATALSPCVLPILPAILGAGMTGGRRRPLGIVTGLVLSFVFATIALVYLIDALGLPDDIARWIAIVVLAGFGLMLLIPPLAAQVEAWISRIAPAGRAREGEGFGSGLLLGASLGFVYTPCAGPILAGVITVSATQDFALGRLAIAFAYGVGSAVVLYALLVGGRRLADRLRPHQARFQAAIGAVMILVAVGMAAELDLRFEESIADDLPSALVNPTERLESAGAVSDELAQFRGAPHGAGFAEGQGGGPELPVLGRAPEFEKTGMWFNAPEGGLTMAGLKDAGQVTLLDFWTYTCINCIRTLPHLRAWEDRYGDEGLTIVGVHTPEFPFERDSDNVGEAIERNDLRYPVVQDNDYGTWDAWANQYWPAKYLVDHRGRVRYVHFGEGGYEETERAIRELLAEAGRKKVGRFTNVSGETPDPGVMTPETYLGADRAQGFVNGPLFPGTRDFGQAPKQIAKRLPPNGFAYEGQWTVEPESATAGSGARLSARFLARRVFVVMGSPDRERGVEVSLDGKPIPGRLAGEDVEGSKVTVGDQRLYRLVDLPEAGRHLLTLSFEPGVEGYAFTFG